MFTPELQWTPSDLDSGTSNHEALPNFEKLKQTYNNFVSELHLAHQAYITGRENKTSLPFVVDKFQLPTTPLVQEGEIFEILVLGGTDMRKAFCTRWGGKTEIVHMQNPQPLTHMETFDKFHSFLDEVIDPSVNVVAINFANHMRPVFDGRRLDGKILEIYSDRAVAIPGLTGQNMGEHIEAYLTTRRGKSPMVTVAGDGLCQLLSARENSLQDNIAFGVVGTGYNLGFLLDADTFVNLDAASFNKFPVSPLAQYLADEPGAGFPFGKEVNGHYLYKHFNLALAEHGIDNYYVSSTKQLSELSSVGIPNISEIAQRKIAEAAQLVACQIAGVADFKKQDMTFVMDGSVFWKAHRFYDIVCNTLPIFTDKNIQFANIPDVNIRGASKLVIQ